MLNLFHALRLQHPREKRSQNQQVGIEPPPSAINMTLPAFAA